MSFHLSLTCYIRLRPDYICLRNVQRGLDIECAPWIALDKQGSKPKVLAVGDEARQLANGNPDITVKNPFTHPRMLISDFTAALLLIRHLMHHAFSGERFFSPSPRVILHPDFLPEGGFTEIEVRAMKELCLGAGAIRCEGWQGRPLEDAELLAGKFPSDGVKLW
jgi:rod shape-determining protein MreB